MAIRSQEELSRALAVFSESFCRVYEADLTDDTYRIIKVSGDEFIPEGCSLSEVFADFLARGCVYEEDRDRFMSLTKLEFLRDYFADNDSFQIRYRRLKGSVYRWSILKLIRHPDYTDSRQIVYLYVYDTHAEPVAATRYRNDHLKILNSISQIYISMHLIDLRRGTITLYGSLDHIEVFRKTAGEELSLSQQMRNVISNVVIPEYIDEALAFTDLDTIAERMGNRKVIAAEFIGKFKGWFKAQFVAIDYGDDGKLERVVFTTRVIEEEMRKLESFKKLSETDELTLTSNRRVYVRDIRELKDSDRWIDATLIYADINGLKTANDTIGHKAGDELIVGAAYCLSTVFNSCGKVYRVGGDEFIVITNITGQELSKKLQSLDEKMKSWKGESISELSFSIGKASVRELAADGNPESVSIKDLIHSADKAMYRSKEQHYSDSRFDRRAASRS